MEIIDLYDAFRNKIGRTMVRGEAQPQDAYIIVVHCAIFNCKGELLIQKRQSTKKKWGDLWDISVGGAVVSGENSNVAIERELYEELGIKYNFQSLRPAMTIYFERGFDDIYTLELNIDCTKLHLQEEEVKEVRWASLEQIMNLIEKKEFVPYSPYFTKILYFLNKNKSGIQV